MSSPSSPREPGQRATSLGQAHVLWCLAVCLFGVDVVDLAVTGVSHGAIVGAGFIGAIAALIEVDVLLRHAHAEGYVAMSSTGVGRALVGMILALSIAGTAVTSMFEFGGAGSYEIKAILFGTYGAVVIASGRAFAQNSPRRIGTLAVVVAVGVVVVGMVENYCATAWSGVRHLHILHAPQNFVVFLIFHATFALALCVGLWSSTRWRRLAPAVAGPVAQVRLRS